MSPQRHRPRSKKNRVTIAKPNTLDAPCVCGKKAYPSKGDATRAARLTKEHLGELVHAYHCPKAAAWHVGHPSGTKYR